MVKGSVMAACMMQSYMMIKSMISVMNVKLGVYEISTLQRKNRASLMNEFFMQDKGVRTTITQIDS